MTPEVFIAAISGATGIIGVIVGQVMGRSGRRRDLLTDERTKYAAQLWQASMEFVNAPLTPVTEKPEPEFPHPSKELTVLDSQGAPSFGVYMQTVVVTERISRLRRNNTNGSLLRVMMIRSTMGAWSRGSWRWPFWRLLGSTFLHAGLGELEWRRYVRSRRR